MDANQNRTLTVDYQCKSKKTTMSISNAELFETETAPAQITTHEQENRITITSKNRVLELYLMRGPVAILKKETPAKYIAKQFLASTFFPVLKNLSSTKDQSTFRLMVVE